MDPTIAEDEGAPEAPRSSTPRPGLLVVHSRGGAQCAALPVGRQGVELGRSEGSVLEDASVSRRHARVSQAGPRWIIEDLKSRNGTFVDGVRVQGAVTAEAPRVLRLGSAVLLFCADVGAFGATPVRAQRGVVAGPTMRAALDRVQQVARLGANLHLTGESGVGKEIAARAFHDAGTHPSGAFVAVNCAAIPSGLAERLFFGAQRGTFSGADADAPGYVQAADRGTLFLDEIGELDLSVQAKLLRVLESREVVPLGAVRAQTVDVRVCSATLRDLPSDVGAGRFREDLYFRLGRPNVRVPALRERPEEIPWLVDETLRAFPRPTQASGAFVEACLLYPWPGNVRELQHALREAASRVDGDDPHVLRPEHLPQAGERSQAPADAQAIPGSAAHRAWVEGAMRASKNNVAGAARALGVHRTQLRRWITRYGLSKEDTADED